MDKPPILKNYKELKRSKDSGALKQGKNFRLTLRDFIENYATSLSNVIKVFPKSNLDINALEAHIWDRLKYFFQYDSFKDVSIETPEEVKFINEAIKLIEEWFYEGDWTSCLVTPSDEDIQKMLSGKPR
jgi:hypothetical protein